MKINKIISYVCIVSFFISLMPFQKVQALINNPIQFGVEYSMSVLYGDDNERRVQITVPSSGYVDLKLERYFDSTGDEGNFRIDLIGEDQIIYLDNESTEYMENKTQGYNNIRIGLKAGIYNLSIDPTFYMTSGIGTVKYMVNYTQSNNFEIEKNDTKMKATPVNFPTPFYGIGNNYLEDDYYKFTVSTTKNLKLNFKINPNIDFGIYLMSGTDIISIFDPDSMTINGEYYEKMLYADEYRKTLLSPGTYYLEIHVYGRNVSYGFGFDNVYPTQKLNASDDSQSKIIYPIIEFNKEYSASVITGDDDERRRKIEVPSNGYININLQRYFDSTGDEGEFYVSLVGEDQTKYLDKISTNDLGGKTSTYNNIKFGLKKGVYYLSFEPAFYMSSGIATVKYLVNYTQSNNFELEKNDTKMTANTINVYSSYNGMATNYLEDDYYKFSVTGSNKTKLKFKVNPDLDFSIHILSSTKTIDYIGPEDMDIDGEYYIFDLYSDSYSKTPLQAGTYYMDIKVYGRNEIYNFSINESIPSPINIKSVSSGYNSIKASWGAVTGASGYELLRSTSSAGTYALVTTTTATNYTNTGLSTATTYYYKVRAYRLVGTTKVYSGYSTIVSAKPVPAVPVSIKSVSKGYNSINTSWGAVTGASGYELWRSTSSTGTYALVKTTTAINYTNTGLATGKTYYYKVRAYRLVGTTKVYSGYSAIVNTKPIPATPTNFKVVRASATSINTTWSAVYGANGYELLRSTSSTGTYNLIKTTTSLSFVNVGLATGTTYYYKIRSYRLVGTIKVYGNFSSVVSTKTY